jgi:hypothetical protein
MTNNTERKAFEEWWLDQKDRAFSHPAWLALAAWQAALSQREQVGNECDYGCTCNKHYAAPAPSLCTAEEAAELAKECGETLSIDGRRVLTCLSGIRVEDLAMIINADRAKR